MFGRTKSGESSKREHNFCSACESCVGNSLTTVFFTRHDHMFVIFRLNVYELSVFCFSVVVCVVCFCCAHFTLDTDSYLFQMTALSNSMEKHTAKFHSIYISRALFNRTLHDLCGWKRKNMYCTFHVRNNFFF